MTTPDSVYAELARLRDRVAELEAEIDRRDRNHSAEVSDLMTTTGLTIGMARIMVALATGRPMSRDQLAAICGHADGCDPRLVDSQIKRLRRRLPWLQITSLYGAGYVISGEALTTARDFMKGGHDGQSQDRLHCDTLQRDPRSAGHWRQGNPRMAQGQGLV